MVFDATLTEILQKLVQSALKYSLSKKNAPLLFPQISHQWKKIFAPNFHYFVDNLVGIEMECSNFSGKISLKLEMKSSRNGAFFNQNISLLIGWKLRFFCISFIFFDIKWLVDVQGMIC